MSDEIILTADESRALIHAMTHPDEDALRKRDAFIRGVKDLRIDYEAGEITAEVELSNWTQ